MYLYTGKLVKKGHIHYLTFFRPKQSTGMSTGFRFVPDSSWYPQYGMGCGRSPAKHVPVPMQTFFPEGTALRVQKINLLSHVFFPPAANARKWRILSSVP